MKNSLKRFTAVLACTALTAALALPARAAEDQPIRVGSYKGTTLEVGERSGLVIGPGGPAYTVTSSDPDTVEVEQVMNFWTAVAKAEGSAEITVSNQTGETATLTLTVGSHAPQAPTVESSPDQGEALDVRLELVRLVNEVRRENGVAELPVSEALMSAAQTISDMLNLPVPKANYHNIVLKPSEQQKEMVAALGQRAEKVRNRMVDSTEDNMLLITNDGRKLALDQRLLNPLLPDSDTSKINACVGDVFDIWQRTADQRSAQMVFCDLSTPGKNRPIEMVPNEQGGYEMAEFQNVYDDLRNKLIARGIPAEEIAYIHSANTETQKKELFGKVRSGQVRVLIGSTQKMGAGTNVQKKLVALHHLDCPWRPSDLQQREGRIIRQGNENNEVDIYTYVTENTFDSYLYQLVEGKQKFIGQIMTSKSPVRSCEDIDETALSYAEIKALCTGNPHIKEKMDLDIDVQRLRLLKANHLSQRYALEDQIIKTLPQQIAKYEQSIEGYLSDMDRLKENTHPNEDGFSPMEVEGTVYTDKKAAGSAILAACKAMTSPEPVPLGQYRGFSMDLSFASLTREFKVTLKGALYYTTNLGTDVFGNILRLDNLLESMEERISTCREQLENTRMQLENAKLEVDKPFPQEDELKRKSARLDELNILLNMDKRESEIVDGDVGDEVTAPARGSPDRER